MIEAVKAEAKERFDTPGIVFDKLGVNYSGPVDGHDVAAVVDALNRVKNLQQPQILHLITQKGKGYEPAELDSIKYHGVSAFSLGEKVEPQVPAVPKAKTYSDVFVQALIDVAEMEPGVVAITPATAEGSGLVKFGKTYPDRFFDVAICEQHAVTMAAGMAKEGLKPVISIYSTFLQRAMDQVIHDVAILNLPVLFGIDRGGLVEDGETHQGVFDIAYLRAVPNFTVLAPKDADELQDMIYTALQRSSGPVAIRFPRDKAVKFAESHKYQTIDYEKWEAVNASSVAGSARKLAILAYGAMVETALQALPLLEQQGINPTIVNARCCKPLDEQFLSKLMADGYDAVITIEEGVLAGGFGAAVLEWSAKMRRQQPSAKRPPIFCLGIEDHFVEHGARNILLDLNGLTPEKIAEFAAGCLAS
jgi:1-deoxy-D-xylulose-5-phosphate synthase